MQRMGIEEVNRIKKKFETYELHPHYREHEAAITSEEASKHRGDTLKQGIKALLFTDGKSEFVIVNVPADKKVDVKKVAQQKGWSRGATRMATQEEVLEQTGCQIGAVPPFGHKNALPILVDTGIYENQKHDARPHPKGLPFGQMSRIGKFLNTVENKYILEVRLRRSGVWQRRLCHQKLKVFECHREQQFSRFGCRKFLESGNFLTRESQNPCDSLCSGSDPSLKAGVSVGPRHDESAFNIGLRTHSVKILTSEMKLLFEKEHAHEGIFIKEDA